MKQKTMIELTCSPEFSEVLIAIDAGRDVRRTDWPADVVLRKVGRDYSIFQLVTQRTTKWNGPSVEEALATNWIVI